MPPLCTNCEGGIRCRAGWGSRGHTPTAILIPMPYARNPLDATSRPSGPPVTEADDLERVAAEQAGILTVRQAARLVGECRLRGHVRGARWRAVCRGIVATSNDRLTRVQQLWVAVLAAGEGAALAGTTAATEAGVRGLRTDQVHVLLPAGRHAPSRRLGGLPPDMRTVVVHRSVTIPAAHLAPGRPWRTTTARALVDAAAWAAGAEEAWTALAAGCQQSRVTPAELRDVVAMLPKARRRALILRTLGDIECAADVEVDVVWLCRRFGLPAPDLHEWRSDATGRTHRLEAYWRAWRVRAEVDGTLTSSTRGPGCRTAAGTHGAGTHPRTRDDQVLRFPLWLARMRPADVAGQVRRALLAAGWRPDG